MPQAPITDARRDQMFPAFDAADIKKLERFGERRQYKSGALAARAGEPTEGLMLVLTGHLRIAAHDNPDVAIVVHGPGEIQGELTQLSGRPSLVDAKAEGDVEV